MDYSKQGLDYIGLNAQSVDFDGSMATYKVEIGGTVLQIVRKCTPESEVDLKPGAPRHILFENNFKGLSLSGIINYVDDKIECFTYRLRDDHSGLRQAIANHYGLDYTHHPKSRSIFTMGATFIPEEFCDSVGVNLDLNPKFVHHTDDLWGVPPESEPINPRTLEEIIIDKGNAEGYSFKIEPFKTYELNFFVNPHTSAVECNLCKGDFDEWGKSNVKVYIDGEQLFSIALDFLKMPNIRPDIWSTLFNGNFSPNEGIDIVFPY